MATRFPRSLKAMIWLIVLLAVAYSAWWFVGAQVIQRAGTAALAAQAQAGSAPPRVSVQGFPNRFDVTVAPLALQSGTGRIEWQAPKLDLYALSWRPNHLIADLPTSQRLRYGRLWTDLTVTEARASANFGLSADAPLEKTVFVAKGGQIRAEDLPERLTGAAPGQAITGFDELRLATLALHGPGNRQKLGLELTGLALPPAVRARIGDLPASIDRLHADLVMGLDRPLDRHALTLLPRPGAVEVADLSVAWGPASLSASGTLSLRPDGLLDGDLTLEASHWKELLDLAVASHLLDRDIARTYGRGLDGFAQLSGAQDGRLRLPLTIRDGMMRLGPLPLGPAPQFPPASAF